VHVAATGALQRSRRVADEYTARAYAALPRNVRHRAELEALITAVVERRS